MTRDDAISRQAAIDAMATWDWQELYLPIHFKQLLEELPSVSTEKTQKIEESNFDLKQYRFDLVCAFECGKNSVAEKTGHWITVENEEMETIGYYCSECDLPMETENQTRFCPNCGCRMMEVEE